MGVKRGAEFSLGLPGGLIGSVGIRSVPIDNDCQGLSIYIYREWLTMLNVT